MEIDSTITQGIISSVVSIICLQTNLFRKIFGYGSNKNFTAIRYSEVLLMHAEALVNGASSSVLSADEAVNLVRSRVGLGQLSGVTLDDVLNEKYAEFGMESGIQISMI
jgi:starch-binding outer membrane protein, SusD/RagB family